ncbi:MAG: envelope stress response membrane protein PspB [Nevskiales bacterium]|nr:envelope stress response membrane protein PspB [Nevskiales bacterium]
MGDYVALVSVIMPFAFVIALVGMILHFKDRRRAHEAMMAQATGNREEELLAIADRMERRIDALEQILDAESPGWRKKYHEHS